MTTFALAANTIVTTVEAIDEDAAILAYVRDAGYATVADAAEVCGQTEDEFLADIHVSAEA